jgi:ubiquitin-activating enzyme E1
MKLEEGANIVDGELDEDLHSRQIAVYGRESMHRMAAAKVLVMGMKGLGVEVGAC